MPGRVLSGHEAGASGGAVGSTGIGLGEHQSASREAIEEADLALTSLWPITQYYPSPGGSDERVHLFVGRCDSEDAGGVHGLAEEGEDIRVHVWPLEDALDAVKDGRIDNAASIIALQWLALNRAEVRGLWS